MSANARKASLRGRPPARATTARLQRLLREQETFRRVVESISGELELQPLLERILHNACEMLGADNGTIGLVDPVRDVVCTAATYHMPPTEGGAEMARGVGLAGEVLRTGAPVIRRRYGDLPHPTQDDLRENAVVVVPIRWRGEMIGGVGGGTAVRPARGPRGRARARP